MSKISYTLNVAFYSARLVLVYFILLQVSSSIGLQSKRKLQYSGNIFTQEKVKSKYTHKKEVVITIRGNAKIKMGDFTFYSYLIRIVGKKAQYVEIPYKFRMVNHTKKTILFGKKALYQKENDVLQVNSQATVIQFKKNTKMNRWLKISQIDYSKHDVLYCDQLKRYMKLELIECPNQIRGNSFWGTFQGENAFYLQKEKTLLIKKNIKLNYKQYYFSGSSLVLFKNTQQAILAGPIEAIAFKPKSINLKKEHEKQFFLSDKFLMMKRGAITNLTNKNYLDMVQQKKFSYLYSSQVYFSQNQENKRKKILLVANNSYYIHNFDIIKYRKLTLNNPKPTAYSKSLLVSLNSKPLKKKQVHFIDYNIAFRSNHIFIESATETDIYAVGNITGYSQSNKFLFRANWAVLNNDKSKIKLNYKIPKNFSENNLCEPFNFLKREKIKNCSKKYLMKSSHISVYPINTKHQILGAINAKMANIAKENMMHFIADVNWLQLKNPLPITTPMLFDILTTSEKNVLTNLKITMIRKAKQQIGKSAWITYNTKSASFSIPGAFNLNSRGLDLSGSRSLLNQKAQKMIISGPISGNIFSK